MKDVCTRCLRPVEPADLVTVPRKGAMHQDCYKLEQAVQNAAQQHGPESRYPDLNNYAKQLRHRAEAVVSKDVHSTCCERSAARTNITVADELDKIMMGLAK